MKKIFSILVLLFLVSSFAFATHDDRFIDALKTCSPYESLGVLDIKGISADYTSKIVGWIDDKCLYRKSVKFSGINTFTECKFSKGDIDQLINVMN